LEKTDYRLNISVTEHFAALGLADEYCETAPIDTLCRLIWRATGEMNRGDKQEYVRRYAQDNGIKPKPEFSFADMVYKNRQRTIKKRDPSTYGFQVRWKIFRDSIIQARGETCEACGADGRMIDRHMHVDHITPRAEAPDRVFDTDNVMVLCPSCHSVKTNKDRYSRKGKSLTQIMAEGMAA
jgi:5-methylcytosine-specific restriction endonuclease McrA